MNATFFFLIFKKFRKSSENTIRPSFNCFEWHIVLNAILPRGKTIIMYITYGKVFGGTPNILMFWIFPENGSISEQTVNRALIVHTTLYNSALTKIYINLNFRHVPKLSIGFNLTKFCYFTSLNPNRMGSWPSTMTWSRQRRSLVGAS